MNPRHANLARHLLILGRQSKVLRARVSALTAELRTEKARLVKAEAEAREHADHEHEREVTRLKSQLVGTLSHEFRTPLGIILASLDMLDYHGDKLAPEEHQENLTDIRNAVTRMSGIMEQVLLMGEAESGQPGTRAASPAPAAKAAAALSSSLTHASPPPPHEP